MPEETVYTDEYGTMFKYLITYSHNGETHGFTIWAESREDAEDRLQDIGESGMVVARLEGPQPPLRQGGFSDG